MPKKGSTKKEWEEARKKKQDELLNSMSREQLIEIIKTMDEIIDTNNPKKDNLHDKIIEKSKSK